MKEGKIKHIVDVGNQTVIIKTFQHLYVDNVEKLILMMKQHLSLKR